MKTLSKLFIFAAMVLFSCNTSDDLVLDLEEIDPVDDEVTYLTNPFDPLGAFYKEILTTYRSQERLDLSIINRRLNTTLALNNIQLLRSKSEDSLGKTTSYRSDLDPSLSDLIANSSLSPNAKTILNDFLQDLMDSNGSSMDLVLEQIHDFESEIITSDILSSYDKQVILAFTALVKNGDYAQDPSDITSDSEGDNELGDLDWNISIGNMYSYLSIALSENAVEMAQQLFKSLEGL